MLKKRKALILVNLGTPDQPKVKDVRRYLTEFLNDPRVIDIGWLGRTLLVNLIIVPFRAPYSTRLYKELWTENGSPLLIYLHKLTAKLQNKLTDEYTVYGAMRYGNPSLNSVLENIHKEAYDEIVFLPLFPQYASSTTGSVYEYVLKEVQTWEVIPSIRFIGQFYNHPSFLDAFEKQISKYNPEQFDHILFSYHGLPIRHVNKTHLGKDESNCLCHEQMPEHGAFCYKATCYETSRSLAARLNIASNRFTTSFQSRLSKNWLMPFTDGTLKDLAKHHKKVLVISPSFVADCLETTIEIGKEYQQLFVKAGGDELVWVESLNDRDEWVEAITKMAARS